MKQVCLSPQKKQDKRSKGSNKDTDNNVGGGEERFFPASLFVGKHKIKTSNFRKDSL
jgi:hypothetical protein